MQPVITNLLKHIDIIESGKPKSLPWKPLLEQVITDMRSVQTSHENDGNQLYRSLVEQNKLLMSLILVSIIAGLKK